MPEAQKVELTVPIDETELLRYLLGRYGLDTLREAGVHPESSVIRGLDIDPGGKCSFRICAVSVTDPASLIAEINEARLAKVVEASQTDSDTLNVDYETSEENADFNPSCVPPSCPAAEQTLIRIRKKRKEKDNSP